MSEATIALHAPVAAKTMEHWVDEQLDRLRDAAWTSGVRLGRLWPAWQAQDADWLIELDLRDRAVALEEDMVVGSVLMEMALLGLRPELLSGAEEEPWQPRQSRGAPVKRFG